MKYARRGSLSNAVVELLTSDATEDGAEAERGERLGLGKRVEWGREPDIWAEVEAEEEEELWTGTAILAVGLRGLCQEHSESSSLPGAVWAIIPST